MQPYTRGRGEMADAPALEAGGGNPVEVQFLPPAPTNITMSKKVEHVVLIHGYGVSAHNLWFPWLHQELERRGIRVTAPTMPDPLRPDYKKWMRLGKPIAEGWSPQTLVVAHSLGGTLAMRLLQHSAKSRVAGLVLVSPLFAASISVKPLLAFFQQPIDWRLLRKRAGRVHVIHAKNDPLVPFDHGMRYAEILEGELHLFAKGSHFPQKEFPFLLKTILPYVE